MTPPAADDTGFEGWPPSALQWFDELEADNTKEWFHAHKATYEHDVKGPMVALLDELEDEFGPAKITRPHRDTRFSKDKTPYKAWIYATGHRAGGGGYYVRLYPDGFFVGGGLYQPDRDGLARTRQAIAADRTGAELEAIVADLEATGARLMTDGALKTAPRGYDVDHPRIELLRLPNLAGGVEHPIGPWLHSAEAKDRVVDGWRNVGPLLDWVESHT